MSTTGKTFLIDILHPAHVHFFHRTIDELKARGHRIVITVRSKEISVELLDAYGLDYHLISSQKNGIFLFLEMLIRTVRLLHICLREKPVLLMGIMGPSIAVAGFLLGIPRWVFYDTENAWMTNFFAYPLATTVYTPTCYIGKQRTNEIRYPGYHELAYLHPARFTPDRSVLERNGIPLDRPYFIVRFVGWQASHDVGEKGLTVRQKEDLISLLENYGQVFISSESPLPGSLASRRLQAPIIDIHHILAFARLVVGESATMVSEAAVLGVRAVFLSDTKRGYTLEQEARYGMVGNFSNDQFAAAMDFITKELQDPQSLAGTTAAHQRLLAERIDVTSFILGEIDKRLNP